MKRSVQGFLAALPALVILTCGYLALAGGPPHDATNNIECRTCHALHGTALVPRMLEQEALCKTCHNPTGQASLMSDVAVHTVNEGADIVDCGSCHDAHEAQVTTDPHTSNTAPNLSLIRSDAAKYVSGALEPMIFQSRPAHFAFNDANAPWTGICQSCHLFTGHHTSDGSADHAHNIGTDCVTCHSHESGFAASGGSCLECHNSAQGAGGYRREIVGPGADFERISQHVSDGSQTQIVTDADCSVCHDQSQHQSMTEPQVYLNDPDGGAAYTYDGWGASLEGYCLGCHDADSSLTYGTQPFSDGQTPTDIAQWWSPLSAHSNATASSLPTEKCMSCHGGADSTSSKENNAHGTTQTYLHSDIVDNEAVANDEESLCFACHDADGGASTDIESRFYAVANGGLIYHHPIVDSEQVPGREVECQSCHSHHAATLANPIRGATGIDLNNNPVGPGTANPRQVLEYEICLKCHGDTYNSSLPRTTNKRLDFYPTNSAFHPVIGPGRNQSSAMQNQLLGGLTTSSVIECNDCHNSEATADVNGPASNSTASPQGNHGSNIGWNLRARYIEDPAGAQDTFVPDDFRLCLLRHNQAAFDGPDNNGMTNFNSGGDNFHRYHLDEHSDAVTCANCHYNNHGSQAAYHTEYLINGVRYLNPPIGYKTRLVSFSPDVDGLSQANPTFAINTSTRQRRCNIVCHGVGHSNEPYTPSSSGDNDGLTY